MVRVFDEGAMFVVLVISMRRKNEGAAAAREAGAMRA
jgi:hypothetical protein